MHIDNSLKEEKEKDSTYIPKIVDTFTTIYHYYHSESRHSC